MSEREFDPSYGYSKQQLLSVPAPQEPAQFTQFWQERYLATRLNTPELTLKPTSHTADHFHVYEAEFLSSQAITIRGWLLLPKQLKVRRGFIIGHGYGGSDQPYTDLPFTDAIIFQPSFRGLGQSTDPSISSQPQWHVLHKIEDYRAYILGYCVEDLWLATSALLAKYPQLQHHLGFLGISFSGGIGALALAFDHRISKAHVNVPSFGNYQVRLQLPTLGSGHSVQCRYRRQPSLIGKTLAFHDAAIAAKYIRAPIHFACAKSDAVVAPPGQFAIYNAVTAPKALYLLRHGHADYKEKSKEDQELMTQLVHFFQDL